MHRLDLSLHSHLKEFLRNGVRTHVNSKGKTPSTRRRLRGGSNPCLNVLDLHGRSQIYEKARTLDRHEVLSNDQNVSGSLVCC